MNPPDLVLIMAIYAAVAFVAASLFEFVVVETVPRVRIIAEG